MGVAGFILPIFNTSIYFFNIQTNLNSSNNKNNLDNRKKPAVFAFVRLFLEWLSIPIFCASISMPQSVIIHWITSNLFQTFFLNYLLRHNKTLCSYFGLPSQNYVSNDKIVNNVTAVKKNEEDNHNAFESIMREAKRLSQLNRYEDAANMYLFAAEQYKSNNKTRNDDMENQIQESLFKSAVSFNKAGKKSIAFETLSVLNARVDEQESMFSSLRNKRDKSKSKRGDRNNSCCSQYYVPTKVALAQLLLYYSDIDIVNNNNNYNGNNTNLDDNKKRENCERAIQLLREATKHDNTGTVDKTYLQPLINMKVWRLER